MRLNYSLLAACIAVAGWSSLLAAQTTVTFQQGVGGYNDCFDRKISLSSSATGSDVDTSLNSFFIDGDPNDSSRADYLIRFDNIIGAGAIPAGATILDATLTLQTTSSSVSGNSQSGESYNVYRLTQAFDANSTLDGDFGDSDFIFTPFVDGVEPEDNEADFNVGTFDHEIGGSSMAVDQTYTATVTRAVQAWADGDTNFGVAILSDHTDNDDGWSVHSTGSPDPTFRPLLSVTYSTDPALAVVELQNGLDGFNGTTDVFLRETDVSVDGATVSEEFLDGTNGTNSFDNPYMVRFDLSGVPAATSIEKAELIMKTGISSGASDAPGAAGVGYTVHQMLTGFTTASDYGDFAGDFNAMQLAGQIGPSVALFEDIDEAELVAVDVTDMVENWIINGETNHGIYIGANGTSNGWQIFSSGAVDQDLAPMLRIILSSGGGGGIIPPASFNVSSGSYQSGDIADLADSDNSDLTASRSSVSLQAVIAVDVKATTSVQIPSTLSFTFEGSVFARGTVGQQIFLYDYMADAFEQVDVRNAANNFDATVVVTPGGDLSRFVQPGTGCIEARVRFQAAIQRAQYSANIDQMIWEIN